MTVPLVLTGRPDGRHFVMDQNLRGSRRYLPDGESSLAGRPGQRPGTGAFHMSTTGWPCSLPSVDSVPVSSRSSRP